MTLAASGMLETAAKVQYLCTLVIGEEFRQFKFLSAHVESRNHITVEAIMLGLSASFFPVNSPSKKKRVIYRKMRKLLGLKVRHYAVRLINLNE